MQGHDRVLSVEKTTENKFLNMYDLQYENKVVAMVYITLHPVQCLWKN